MRRKEFVLFISDFFINAELILMAIDLAGQRSNPTSMTHGSSEYPKKHSKKISVGGIPNSKEHL